MGNAIKYKHTNVPRHPQERARLKVVQGADFGSTFIITGPTASIGRGEDNDIVLIDLKASRLHAMMIQDPGGNWRIKDHGSSNGILINSKPTRESALQYFDVFTLGETTLEFISPEAGTKTLMSPARSAGQVKLHQRTFQAAKDRVNQSFGQFTGRAANVFDAAGGNAAPGSASKSKKPLIYIVGVVGLGLLLLGDPDKPAKPKSKTPSNESGQDLASFLPTPDFNKSAETIFKDGLREYFVHNYGRARIQFETVLQISPNHVLATLYLENCNKAVEEEVKVNLEGGKKSFEAGKLRDAKGHFETVMRLLFRDQANPAYIEARDQFDQVVKTIKGEVGKT
ncbi:MAG: FHA domain-containing protein [Bdellovibrionia bacterium]